MVVLLEKSSHHLLESGPSTWESFFKSNFLAYCARDEMAHLAHFQSPAGPETTRAILEECPVAHDMIEIMGSAATYFANPTQGRVANVNQWELPFAAKNLIHDLVMLPSPSAVHPLMPESMKALLTNSVASLLENCPEL